MTTTDEIKAALADLKVPEGARGLEKAATAARELGGTGTHRRAPWRRRAVGFAVVLLVAVLAFSEPGRDAASALARVVGIGDEPTVPRRAANEIGAVVVSVGETPEGVPIEVVASAREVGRKDRPAEVCISLDLPGNGGAGGGPCLSRDNAPIVERSGLWVGAIPPPKPFRPHSDVMLAGFVRPDIDAVSVTYPQPGSGTQQLDAELVAVSADTVRAIGAERGAFKYFVAFLPFGVLEGTPEDPSLISSKQTGEFLKSVEVHAFSDDAEVAAKSPYASSFASALSLAPPDRFKSVDALRQKALEECGETRRTRDPEDLAQCVERALGHSRR